MSRPGSPLPFKCGTKLRSFLYSWSLTMSVSALDARDRDAGTIQAVASPHSPMEDSSPQPGVPAESNSPHSTVEGSPKQRRALLPADSHFSLSNTVFQTLTANVDSPEHNIAGTSSRALLAMPDANESFPRPSRAATVRSNNLASEKMDDAAPVVNESTANEESTFENESKAMQIKVLYHWCVTAGVLLFMQIIADALLSKYRHVPNPAQLCAILLLLYALALVVTVHFVRRARPYAVYLLGFGSVLMTGQVAWHWESHAAQFRASNGTFPGQPSFWDMNFCNTTTSGQGSADLLPHTSPYGLAFGCSGAELLETATFFIILFQHCVQSSFLSRLGIRFTAIVSLTQWLLLACWPLMFPDVHGTWLCRITATGVWTAHLLQSSWFSQSVLQQHTQAMDDLQKAAAQSLKNQMDAQHADSVLNHILKNTMADALGCIEIFCRNPNPDTSALSKACDILFRGMWWCKLRVAMLRIVAGCYETQRDAVDLKKFAEEFVRGRDTTLQCPPGAVHLDSTACNIILDNAVTNAMRHGCPGDPQVKLVITVSERTVIHSNFEASLDSIIDAGPKPVTVRFRVTNQADPSRPALSQSWSSKDEVQALPTDSSRPTLSDGLGLQHIRMVANSCDMIADLWQEGARVCFQLRVDTTIADSAVITSNAEPLHVSCPFPPGLTILGLDDSDIARQTLQFHFEKEIPSALRVAMYGKDVEEVEQFKQDALENGDILIVDENVDVPGEEQLGSTVVKELMAAGYDGFACIRSGNSEDADIELSLASGAHWHVGKEVRMRDMISELRGEYEIFLVQQVKETPDTNILNEEVRGCGDGSEGTCTTDAWPSITEKPPSDNLLCPASSSAREDVFVSPVLEPASDNRQPSPTLEADPDAMPRSSASSSGAPQVKPRGLRSLIGMSPAKTEPKMVQSRSGLFLPKASRAGFFTEPGLPRLSGSSFFSQGSSSSSRKSPPKNALNAHTMPDGSRSVLSSVSDRGAASAYGLQSFDGLPPGFEM